MLSLIPRCLNIHLLWSFLVCIPFLSATAQDTLSIQISTENPFFDDFSSGRRLPDSSLWLIDSEGNQTPLVSFHMAQSPPSWGVLSFDGADVRGIPYNTQAISSGIADELRSHYIDLSSFTPADQLVLSFFLQPQGLGNAPESADSFQILCTRSDQSLDSLENLMTIAGSSLTPFRQYHIPLNDPAYFHEKFQLVFRSIGSLNGYLDHWHLDYIFLGPNRTISDTTYQDQAIQDFTLTILDPFTLYPAQLFPPLASGNAIYSAKVNNLSLQSAQVGTQLILIEPNQNMIQFGQELDVFPYQANSLEIVLRDALSAFEGTFGSLDVQIQLANAGITSSNDFLRYSYRIDSLMGYDDGEADASYGLTRARGYGVQYTLPSNAEAFLSAVWISFVPRVDVSPSSGGSEYLDGKGFQWVIWDAPHPDSIVHRQSGVQVNYGDSLNHFERYALDESVLLPDTFWLGIQQIDGVPLGVGLDRNAVSNRLFWDSAGVWTPSRIVGSPMIRAEIQGERPLPTPRLSDVSASTVSVYPNPLTGKTLFIQASQPISFTQIELWSITGRKIFQQPIRQVASGPLQITLPAELSPGIYIFKASSSSQKAGASNFSCKLLIN